MWIDIIAVLFIGGVTYLGYRQGVLKQALSIVAIVLAVLFAGLLARQLQRILNIGYVPNLIICAIVIYAIARVIFWLINRQFGKEAGGQPMPWNRNFGIAMGLVKGEVLAWGAACLVLTMVTAFPNATPGIKRSLERSVTGRIAQSTNPFGFIGDFFAMTSEVMSDEAKRKALYADPTVQSFLREEKVQKLMASTSVLEKLRACDYEVIQKAKKVGVMEALERATGRAAAQARGSAPGVNSPAKQDTVPLYRQRAPAMATEER